MSMQFEYDEKGGTFYYFLLSFMALVLVPVTYYLWPRSSKKDKSDQEEKECHCDPCMRKKQILQRSQPFKNLKRYALKFGILLAWIIFALVAYKTSQVELDWTEFDPYAELGIDRDAADKEIKKAYRKLSLVYHPDKETGDAQRFMRISKAYQALTDEEAKENWKTYGNPDGPGVTHFGIALPKWIVEKQNSIWVLGIYGLVFMVILPVTVGTWWYRSIQFSSEQILMDTARLYNIFLQKTPNMILKRVLMVLAASFEFDKGHNNEIVQRPSDNEEIPRVMKYLPHLGEKNKERPLCYYYSIKARTLLHAHVTRLESLTPGLKSDQEYVVKKCPYLLNEMVSIAAQHVALSHAGKARMPNLSTIENMMRISQMIVQALWDHSNPLLQLPHVTEDILKHFVTKKRNIRSIERFATLKDEERRLLVRTLTEKEYQDVINVCRSMPLITLEAHTEVKDDEDTNTITAGSIVTVTVNLNRQPMYTVMDLEDQTPDRDGEDQQPEEEQEEETEESQAASEAAQKSKPKVWEKQKKKSKGKGAKKGKKPSKPAPAVKKPATTQGTQGTSSGDAGSNQSTPKRVKDDGDEASDEGSNTGDEQEDNDSDGDGEEDKTPNGEVHEDEEFWEEMQRDLRKENKLETKSKETHVVHCPYFPTVKYEWYWLYIADRKTSQLISAPVHVCSLVEQEEFQLKFSAPFKPGNYTYAVILRSDSYLDLDIFKYIKLEVSEAKKVEDIKQWDFSDEEEKVDEDLSESDDITDSDDDD